MVEYALVERRSGSAAADPSEPPPVTSRYLLPDEVVPTPLIRPREHSPVQTPPLEHRHRWRGARLLLALLHFAIRSRFDRWFFEDGEERAARRLRDIFERFGGLWIKLGQLLSLRTDTFSDEICRELAQLQFRAVGFPVEAAIAEIEKTLGGPLGRTFREFDYQPFAAASISQVHRATLRGSGVSVIVKVRRPGIVQGFAADMRTLTKLVGALSWMGLSRHMRWDDALWELEQMMREELDYRYEAANLARMRKSLKAHGVYVPKPYFEISGSAVIVMEFVPGVLMSDYIQVGSADPERVADWCEANGVRPKKVAQRLFISALRQLLEDNLFHADLHPGNIILLRDNRIALIDMGTIGTLERDFLQLYMMGLRSLAQKDYARAADYLLRLCPDIPTMKLGALRRDLIRTYRIWEGRTHLRNVPYHDKALSSAGTDTGRVLYKYKVQPTWTFMRISRTWSTLDASMQFLVPGANYMSLFERYFRSVRQRAVTSVGLRRLVTQRLVQALESAQEYDLLLRPLIRNETLMLQGTIGKVAHIGGIILRALIFAFFFGFVFTLTGHLYFQHGVGQATLHEDVVEVISFMSDLSYVGSVIVLGFVFWVIVLFRRLLRTTQQPDHKR